MACAFAVSMAICATASASALAADTALEPGFPVRAHSTGGTYAAGPATAITVGDIDGDAVPEIVASAVASGPLYAWHGDGTLVDGWPRPEAQGVVYAGLGELTRRTPGFEVAAGGGAIRSLPGTAPATSFRAGRASPATTSRRRRLSSTSMATAWT